MSKSHLVPTAITNVNGVATTVYRRPERSSSSTAIPAVQPVSAPRGDTVDALMSRLGVVNDVIENRLRVATPEQLQAVSGAIDIAEERHANDISDHDIELLQSMIHGGAFSAISHVAAHGHGMPDDMDVETFGKYTVGLEMAWRCENEFPVDVETRFTQSVWGTELAREFISIPTPKFELMHSALLIAAEKDRTAHGVIDNGCIEGVLRCMKQSTYARAGLLVDYRDDIPQGMSLDNIVAAVMVARAVASPDSVKDRNKVNPATIGAHLYAASRFEPSAGSQSYESSSRLVAAVEKYPEHVDAIYEYRRDRQAEDFESDDFQEYLAAGPVRDGML